MYRRRILAQGNFFLKQNPSEANRTIDDLKEMLHSQSYDSLMSKLMHYAKNVSGTNAYWNRAKDALKESLLKSELQQSSGLYLVLSSIGQNFITCLATMVKPQILNAEQMSLTIRIYLTGFSLNTQNNLLITG